ncbi:MAG: DUF1700 domain-containing protein [Clostridium sp.]|nr:DUF1700 domain-containing protein [Clostridium sp.]
MDKNQFLNMLKYHLRDFNKADMDDILYDYEEHFRVGKENGKSEYEISKELGNPEDIANQYREASGMGKIDTADTHERSIAASIFIFIALLMFNLIFILGIYLGIAGVLIGMCAVGIALTFSGVAIVFCIIFGQFFSSYVSLPDNVFTMIASFFGGIGTIALGLLLCIGMFYVVKFFAKSTVKYVKWNFNVIKG